MDAFLVLLLLGLVLCGAAGMMLAQTKLGQHVSAVVMLTPIGLLVVVAALDLQPPA